MGGIRRRHLIVFFVLAFALSWTVWMTSVAQAHGWLSFHIPQSLAFWLGLTIATYLTAGLSGGKAAIRDLVSRMLRWRVSPRWYAVAVGLPFAMGVAGMALARVMGHAPQVGDEFGLILLVPVFLLELWLFLLTEETAWRGFALPRLQRRYSLLNASLILGVLWGLWHIPLFLIPDSFQAGLPFAGFFLSTVATSIMVSWLFNNARGSVLVCAVFHAMTDVAIAYLGVMNSGRVAFWVFVGIQCAVAVGLIVMRPAWWRQMAPRDSELVYGSSGEISGAGIEGDFGLADGLAGRRA